MNKREVEAFPLDLDAVAASAEKKRLTELADELMKDLQKNSAQRILRFQHDTLTVQCIYPKASKSILDEIDLRLGKHYGFTDAELDFIINYDIKYRLGQDEAEDAE